MWLPTLGWAGAPELKEASDPGPDGLKSLRPGKSFCFHCHFNIINMHLNHPRACAVSWSSTLRCVWPLQFGAPACLSPTRHLERKKEKICITVAEN